MLRRALPVALLGSLALAVSLAFAGVGQTYYVGSSSGACGTVHYYGSSNGIGHRTIENAERNCAKGCEDVWLNWQTGGQVPGSFVGICNVDAGYLIIWQGDHSNPISWCDGHPAFEYFQDTTGRCEYKYIY